MNLEVYTFCSLLKEYDEEFNDLTYQEQYDLVPKYHRQFLNSMASKEITDTHTAMITYLEEKYAEDDSMDIEFEN
jgi:hypothetical protein